MVNNYYSLSDRVDIENTNNGRRFSDPEFVKQMLTNVSSKIDLINAIEDYNDTHKLNEQERIKYSVGIGGEFYITVIKAYKLGGENSTTYAIVGRDINGYGRLNKSDDSSKSNTYDPSISTHIVDIQDITDVWIAGYDKDKLYDIFNTYNTTDEISEKELTKILTTLKTDLNAIHAQGEYRYFINKFTWVMRKNDINNLTFIHRQNVYNLYTAVWVKYISVLKDIITNYTEKGCFSINWETTRVFPSLFFVDTSSDTSEDTEDIKIKKILKEEFNKKYPTVSEEWKEANIDAEVENMYLKTFSVSEINIFKQLVNPNNSNP